MGKNKGKANWEKVFATLNKDIVVISVIFKSLIPLTTQK